jgi:hypothetical protein
MAMFVTARMAIISLVRAAIAPGLDRRAASNLQITADEPALPGATAFINTASPKASDRLGRGFDDRHSQQRSGARSISSQTL